MLVTRCKTTCYSLQNLLVSRCRSCSLQKITRYSLENCSFQKITCYSLQISLVTLCRSCSLQKITRYSFQKLLVAKNYSSLVMNKTRELWLFKANKDRWTLFIYSLFSIDWKTEEKTEKDSVYNWIRIATV